MKMKKICSNCGKDYTHEPLMLDGEDLLANHTVCDPCERDEERERKLESRKNKARQQWVSAVPEEYRQTDTNFNGYPMAVHSTCEEWMKGKGVNGCLHFLFLGLIGISGSSKSRVAALMAKIAIWGGKEVLWMNSSQFQWCVNNLWDDDNKRKAKQWLRKYRKAQFLIFDDLGTLKSKEGVSDELYSLLEYRTTRCLPMIWTSNEDTEEIMAGLPELPRKRITSRLVGFSNMIAM